MGLKRMPDDGELKPAALLYAVTIMDDERRYRGKGNSPFKAQS
jgi:hypothetical protein